MEFFGRASWLKAGLLEADRVTTVSPTYAREIVTAAGGAGMDGVLRAHAKGLTGILNGIDPGVWNPSTDPHLAARYDVSLGEYIICRTRNVGLQNSDYIGGIRCVGHPPRARACGRGHSAGAAACGRGHSGAAARASLTCTSLRLSPY